MEKRLLGLIGHPLKHSLSPILFNEVFKKMNLDYEYHAFEIKPQDLEKAAHTLSQKGYIGYNVTLPHKVTITKHIEVLNPFAKLCGSVNTVIIPPHGGIIGDNTDGQGFLNSLAQDKIEIDYQSPIMILGAGGAARGLAATFANKNATTIYIVNRTLQHAESLCEQFAPSFPFTQFIPIHLASHGLLDEALGQTRLLINATAVGLYKSAFHHMPLEMLSKKCVVCDLVYNPYITPFLARAKELNLNIHHGLGTLIHQAILAFKLWTNIDLTPEIFTEVVNEKINIQIG